MTKEHEDSEGHQRVMCPAEAGEVQCPIKSLSMGRGVQLPLVDPEPSPAGPLKVCHQRSITLVPVEGSKYWQALEYGGEQRQKVYFQLCNSVEGYNGYAKSPLAEAIEAAGGQRIRGTAAQAVLLVFQLAHANQRKIKNWVKTLAPSGERRTDAPTTAGRPNRSALGPRPATYHRQRRHPALIRRTRRTTSEPSPRPTGHRRGL
ncbi:hypothetical protein [Streptomyces sp. AcE210]|uniref:hypothetical protein n=1 Tax=Streptomyces sp. AcE210 TaxID=2292703 RepID=UPI0010585849|nr:hypothetical protein [Streptomyces sp. AcE210]